MGDSCGVGNLGSDGVNDGVLVKVSGQYGTGISRGV